MNNIQYLALILLLGTASQSFAKSGTVSFSGEITAETCTASVNGATGQPNNVVVLPKVALGSLSAADTTAADTQFGIKITSAAGQTCDIENTVSGIYFEPNSQLVNSEGRLNNSDNGGAQNVELRLLNSLKNPIDLTKNYGLQESSTVNAGVFNYYAQYYASSGAVTAGKLASAVDYTIIYK